jgi:hypothetical protein
MEPWDGPASIAFTDGTVIGAVLDRNGLRPSRYYVTKDGLVVMASEVGVLDIAPENIALKGRLHPGKIFLVDTAQGRIIDDEEIKGELAAEHPYADWLTNNLVALPDLPAHPIPEPDHATVLTRQLAFGYTHEDLRILLGPMASKGEEPVGSMGTDTALAVLSDRPRPLYDYFKQLFAQVTNPPLDQIREELVTSMESTVGPEGNLLEPGPRSCRQITLADPVLSNEGLAKLVNVSHEGFKALTLPMLFPIAEGTRGLERALEELRTRGSRAVAEGYNVMQFAGVGTDYPVLNEIREMYRKQGKPAPKEMASTVYYNRGVLIAAVHLEAIKNALKAKPDGKITGDDVRKGFERIDKFTLGGLVPPLKITPNDHEGGGLVQIWQAKGGKFDKMTDWFSAYNDVVAKHIKEAGARK